MIFTAEQARLILSGRKSQARRLALQPPKAAKRATSSGRMPAPALGMSDAQLSHTTKHRVGNVYPLERFARGDELAPDERLRLEDGNAAPVRTVAHMELIELRLQRAGDIDLKDARAEGFRTTDEFKAAWVRERDRAWRISEISDGAPDEEIAEHVKGKLRKPLRYSISDERLACSAPSCDALVTCFASLHADTLVWAMSFKIVEAPRLLRAAAGFDDYTETPSRAARAEPEAITDEQLQRLTKYSAAKDDARRRKPLATLADSIARDVDEIRNRMIEEGLVDRDLKRALRDLSHNAERVQRKLDAA